MEQTSFLRLAGWAGIASALLYVVSILGLQAYLAVGLEDMGAFTQNMLDSSFLMQLYGWPGIIATILIIPLVYAFHQLNSSSKLVSRIVFLVVLIGLCFVLVGYLFHLALTFFHAPMYHSIDPENQDIFATVIRSTIGIQDMFWLSGDIFAFWGIGLLLLLARMEKLFPTWLLVLGVVAGFLAGLGSFSFLPPFKQLNWLGLLFINGFVLFAIWEVIAGVLLIKMSKDVKSP